MDEPPASPKTAVAAFSDRKYFEGDEPLPDGVYEFLLDSMKRDLGHKTLDEFCSEVCMVAKQSRDAAKRHLSGMIVGCNKKEVLKVYDDWKKVNIVKRANPRRMVGADYQIQGTEFSHRYDLECFAERVQELFQWWDETDPEKNYVGPYMCFVQSSGMGKTKVLFEYQSNTQDHSTHDKEKVVTFLILPTSTTTLDANKEQRVFDYVLGLDDLELPVYFPSHEGALDEATSKVYEMLDKMFHELTQKNDLTNKNVTSQRIVLLFDESNVLADEKLKVEAFFFRCIRVWLRQKRPDDLRVVGVFAGTSSRLAHCIDASDSIIQAKEELSREHGLGMREYHKNGYKFNPPFVQTTTTGGCRASFPEDASTGEYGRAISYGRPLFAIMAKDGILDRKLSTVLMLNQLVDEWDQNRNMWINYLSSRVHMGQMTMAVTSDLVTKAYANLANSCQESAQLAYLPDPVCARLAMCLMDEDCAPAQYITGKNKQWWARKLKEILSSGIVHPENGDFGEVIVALYMLFCGDLLRKRFNKHNEKVYIQFSVSLDEWLQMLQSGGKMPDITPGTTISEADNTSKVSVGFIQVCRNSLRSYGKSWKSLDNDFLKQVYESGTAFFVYPGCPLIDLVIPLRVTTTTESKFEFVPMFVSIKCRSSFSNHSAQTVCNKMKEQATHDGLARALCLLILFESDPSSPESKNPTVEDVSEELIMGVVSRVIRLPQKDEFGLHEVFRVMTPTAQVHGDLFASHPFLMAHGDRAADADKKAPIK